MANALGNRLFLLQKENKNTDTTFIVQGVEVQCHEIVISSIGGPLAEMINEKNGNRIEINSVSPRTFQTVIE